MLSYGIPSSISLTQNESILRSSLICSALPYPAWAIPATVRILGFSSYRPTDRVTDNYRKALIKRNTQPWHNVLYVTLSLGVQTLSLIRVWRRRHMVRYP